MRITVTSILFFMLMQPSLIVMANNECMSPLNYGLAEASNGIERFRALEKCHKDAVAKNVAISYAGIESLDIEVPAGAASIPLPDEVDFAGVQMNVLNTQKNFLLFVSTNSATPI